MIVEIDGVKISVKKIRVFADDVVSYSKNYFYISDSDRIKGGINIMHVMDSIYVKPEAANHIHVGVIKD